MIRIINDSWQLRKCLTKVEQLQRERHLIGHRRFRKLTIKCLDDEPFLKDLREFVEPGIELIVDLGTKEEDKVVVVERPCYYRRCVVCHPTKP